MFYHPERNPGPGSEMFSMGAPTPVLQFDGARYHRIETSAVPPGWASVPVELNDDGNITKCGMAAGLVGMKFSSSGKDLHKRIGEKGLDTITPVSGWWMYELRSEEDMKAEKDAFAKAYKEKYGFDYFGSDE